jgi:hypothetical protein
MDIIARRMGHGHLTQQYVRFTRGSEMAGRGSVSRVDRSFNHFKRFGDFDGGLNGVVR